MKIKIKLKADSFTVETPNGCGSYHGKPEDWVWPGEWGPGWDVFPPLFTKEQRKAMNARFREELEKTDFHIRRFGKHKPVKQGKRHT